VDEYFPKDARSSAQGLFNLMILGIGSMAANSICPKLLQEVYTHTVDGTKVVDFTGLFLIPLLLSIGAAVVLALFFHPPKQEAADMAAGHAPPH
jgi:hypothetical protein